MGFDGFEFTDVRGYVADIAMGRRVHKIKLTIITKHFQFVHVKVKMENMESGCLRLCMQVPENKEQGNFGGSWRTL